MFVKAGAGPTGPYENATRSPLASTSRSGSELASFGALVTPCFAVQSVRSPQPYGLRRAVQSASAFPLPTIMSFTDRRFVISFDTLVFVSRTFAAHSSRA